MFESFLGVNPWTALFTLLNTLTIFFIGKKFLFGPVMKMIKERQDEIDGMYSDADSAKRDAEVLKYEYHCMLDDAHAASDRIVKEAVARGQAREEEIIREANREASAIMDKAEASIAMEKKKAINDAKDEISGLAMTIAGKVVGRQLNDDDQSKLVDEFINGLGDSV